MPDKVEFHGASVGFHGATGTFTYRPGAAQPVSAAMNRMHAAARRALISFPPQVLTREAPRSVPRMQRLTLAVLRHRRARLCCLVDESAVGGEAPGRCRRPAL